MKVLIIMIGLLLVGCSEKKEKYKHDACYTSDYNIEFRTKVIYSKGSNVVIGIYNIDNLVFEVRLNPDHLDFYFKDEVDCPKVMRIYSTAEVKLKRIMKYVKWEIE